MVIKRFEVCSFNTRGRDNNLWTIDNEQLVKFCYGIKNGGLLCNSKSGLMRQKLCIENNVIIRQDDVVCKLTNPELVVVTVGENVVKLFCDVLCMDRFTYDELMSGNSYLGIRSLSRFSRPNSDGFVINDIVKLITFDLTPNGLAKEWNDVINSDQENLLLEARNLLD